MFEPPPKMVHYCYGAWFINDEFLPRFATELRRTFGQRKSLTTSTTAIRGERTSPSRASGGLARQLNERQVTPMGNALLQSPQPRVGRYDSPIRPSSVSAAGVGTTSAVSTPTSPFNVQMEYVLGLDDYRPEKMLEEMFPGLSVVPPALSRSWSHTRRESLTGHRRSSTTPGGAPHSSAETTQTMTVASAVKGKNVPTKYSTS